MAMLKKCVLFLILVEILSAFHYRMILTMVWKTITQKTIKHCSCNDDGKKLRRAGSLPLQYLGSPRDLFRLTC